MTAPAGKKLLIGPKYEYITDSSTGGGSTIYYQSNYYIGSTNPLQVIFTTSTDDDDINHFYWYSPEDTRVCIAAKNVPQNNDAIASYTVYNGRILSLPKVDLGSNNKPVVRNWYLRNKIGKCIAHFEIDRKSVV